MHTYLHSSKRSWVLVQRLETLRASRRSGERHLEATEGTAASPLLLPSSRHQVSCISDSLACSSWRREGGYEVRAVPGTAPPGDELFSWLVMGDACPCAACGWEGMECWWPRVDRGVEARRLLQQSGTDPFLLQLMMDAGPGG